jgi:hypothetical protein
MLPPAPWSGRTVESIFGAGVEICRPMPCKRWSSKCTPSKKIAVSQSSRFTRIVRPFVQKERSTKKKTTFSSEIRQTSGDAVSGGVDYFRKLGPNVAKERAGVVLDHPNDPRVYYSLKTDNNSGKYERTKLVPFLSTHYE